MATDPTALLQGLLGTTGLGGAIYQNAQQFGLQQQQGQQDLQIGQMQIAQAQQQQAKQVQYDNDVAAWTAGGSTPQGLSTLIARHPQQYQALKAGWDVKDEAQAKSDLGFWGGVHSLLDKGDSKTAAVLIQQRLAAEKAAGLPTSEEDMLASRLASGDADAASSVKAYALSQIAAGVGPDKFAATYKTVSEPDEAFTLTPGSKRFDAKGNLIAAAPAAVHYEKVETTDADGNPVTQLVAVGGEGGGPVSRGAGGDTSRLLNTDAGGGNIPDSVRTLGQFVTYGKALNARGAKSSSAGTYQINGSTMAQFAPVALGDDWRSQPFSAANQDKVGEAIFNWAKQQPNPATALRGRWVSLSPQSAAKLVKGSWQQARGTIAQGETGGGAGASASAPNTPEGGARVLYSAAKGGQGEDAVLDDETTNALAEQYLAGDPSVMTNLGRGKQGAANIVKLRQTIARLAKSRGMNGAQIAATMQDFKTHQQGLNAFARGPEARTVRSLNVTIDHLDTLQNAAQALQNGRIGIFNMVAQKWAKATGSPTPTNFEGVRDIVSAEVAKAITGGQTALADRKDLAHNISTANSPQQLAGYIAEVKKLMAGQLEGLAGQYKSATGRDDFADRLSTRTRIALGYPVKVVSLQQAQALPKGTVFITPDGRRKVR